MSKSNEKEISEKEMSNFLNNLRKVDEIIDAILKPFANEIERGYPLKVILDDIERRLMPFEIARKKRVKEYEKNFTRHIER